MYKKCWFSIYFSGVMNYFTVVPNQSAGEEKRDEKCRTRRCLCNLFFQTLTKGTILIWISVIFLSNISRTKHSGPVVPSKCNALGSFLCSASSTGSTQGNKQQKMSQSLVSWSYRSVVHGPRYPGNTPKATENLFTTGIKNSEILLPSLLLIWMHEDGLHIDFVVEEVREMTFRVLHQQSQNLGLA